MRRMVLRWRDWGRWKRALFVASTLAVALFLGGTLWATLTISGATGEKCPSIADLRMYRPPEATRVFASDGSVVADLSPQRRVVMEIEDLPPLLREGMVAVEDRRFWDHGGVDFRSFARAAVRNIASLSFEEGFSTITMQLARTIFPDELPMSEMMTRKVCEVYLAYRIEAEFRKREILELYLNQIYLGAGLYGVEAAAEGYFDKSSTELSPAETALLIALVRSPEGYNPRRSPELARERRNLVLGILAAAEVLDPAEADAARRRSLDLAPPVDAAGPAPYFVAAVRSALRDRFGPDADVQGLRVYTGLDPHIQRAADSSLTAQIRRIEEGRYGQYSHPTGPAADAPVLQGSVVVLDPHTGDIRALVGGRDFATSQFDRGLQAHRQPGSAFKPVLYATALEAGLPATARLRTGPVSIEAGSGTWRPGDHVADTVETLSVRHALTVSSNNAAVRLGQWVGEDKVAAMARRLGITTDVPPFPSIFLGSAEVIPAELAAAFATFGNGGYRIEPRLTHRVEDRDGVVLWRARPPSHQALDPGVAFLTLTLLEDVVNGGTAESIRQHGFWLPAAGKTGTTNDGKDVWFVGLTPDLVASVWLGFDQPRPIMPGASGGRLAAPVWAEMMEKTYEKRPAPAPWAQPANVVSAQVDQATGYLATGSCPGEDIRIEYFLIGTEPRSYCPFHPESGMERMIDGFWRRLRKIF